MFRDRNDAGRQLAAKLKGRQLCNPLVLGIARGGMVIGTILAQELGAELDVVLSRKLRAPWRPELGLGAVAEDGRVYLTRYTMEKLGLTVDSLARERRYQLAEIARQRRLFRAVRPQAPVAGRSVIVTDDGIATGSTLFAALQVIREQGPREVIVAVPIASVERLKEARRWCDDLVWVFGTDDFWGMGEFYEDFTQVEDQQILDLLCKFAPASQAVDSFSERDSTSLEGFGEPENNDLTSRPPTHRRHGQRRASRSRVTVRAREGPTATVRREAIPGNHRIRG